MTDIVCLVSDLSRNPLYTAIQFAGALGGPPRVQILGPSSGPLWPPMAAEAGGITRLPGFWPWGRGVRTALRAQVEDASLLYAFKAMPASLGLALSVGARLGVPVGLHLDDWDAGFFAETPALRRLGRGLKDWRHPSGDLGLRITERFISSVHFLTVSSSALQRRFGGTIVRQGVDTDRFGPGRFPRDEARARMGLADDRPVAVFAGTLRTHKGALDLLAAAKASGAALRVMIAGVSDPGAADALRRAGAIVVPEYAFAESGWVLAAADFAVLPQHDTPFARHQLPAKLLHALSMGLPVLATDVGDARTLLDGSPAAGLVVPPGDTPALAQALARLSDDRTLRRTLGAEARRRAVEQMGWSAMRRSLTPLLPS